MHFLRASCDMYPWGQLVNVVRRAIPRGQTVEVFAQGVILGVEVALDDDVEIADLRLPTRIETEAAVEGVDMFIP